MNKRPPHIAVWLLRQYCKPSLLESIQGDLEEQFEQDIQDYSEEKAKRRFIWNVIRFFRPGVVRSIFSVQNLNNYGMFKNYFKTSFRFIKREKAFAFMNIAGLALGIACAMVIYKIIVHESSFDKHHTNYESLYRVVNEFQLSDGARYNAGQIHPLANGLRSDFPGIKTAMSFYEADAMITVSDDAENKLRFQEREGITFVEPEFLELFDFEWIAGNRIEALSDQGKVILTQSKVKKYFGLDQDEAYLAIGRQLVLENTKNVFVSAVIADLPSTTDFPFEAIFHYKDQDAANPYFNDGNDWSEYNSSTNCYVLQHNSSDVTKLEAKLRGYLKKHQPEDLASRRELLLQPLSELHGSTTITRNYSGVTVSNDRLVALGLVGLFLIITACINFINLSTAQAVKRAKEIGVRKSLGSSRKQLVFQFLGETLLITTMATAIGLGLSELLFFRIEQIFGYELHLNLFHDLGTPLFILIMVLLVTVISGSYPAIVLARLDPIGAVKNTLSAKKTSGFLSLRRGLVVFQFAISQILIIGTLVLNAQMDYFLTKDLGFNDDYILVTKLPDRNSEKLQVLKNSLLQNSYVSEVSFGTSGPQASWKVNNPISHPGITQEERSGNLKTADEDYLNVYELELVAGRNYTAEDPDDLAVVNRKLTQLLGFDDPVDALGERFKYGRGTLDFTIVGVVEDFHASSFHQEMDNVVFANRDWNIYEAGIKFNGANASMTKLKSLIEYVEEQWKIAYPEHVFDFEFYDERLAKQYENETKISQLFHIIVIMAIIIGCLGLYGLVSFMSNQKTKEIGIRKVMGASTMNIWTIFSREMIALLIIAFAISGPTAYWAMDVMLDNYAYRISLTPTVFVIAILASLIIALLTISFKSISASRANPILSLRDE